MFRILSGFAAAIALLAGSLVAAAPAQAAPDCPTPVADGGDRITTSVQLTASPESLVSGGQAVLTATIDPANATGTVTFYSGISALSTSCVENGSAVAIVNMDIAGERSFTAVYSGDALHEPSTSQVLPFTVEKTPTQTLLEVDRTSVNYGDQVALTASVTGGPQSGQVEFFADGTSLGISNLSNGTATLQAFRLAAGERTITAKYLGNVQHAASTSTGVTVEVAQGATQTTLSASPASAAFGDAVTLTASVEGTRPTGEVEFLADGISIGTAAVQNRVATFQTTSLAVGARELTASYLGDANHAASESTPASVEVTKAATQTTLTADPTEAVLGEPVTFTATVQGVGPTGTVELTSDGGTTWAADLSNGVAVVEVSNLGVGVHTVTARYLGDGSNAGSESSEFTVTVSRVTTQTALSVDRRSSSFGTEVRLTATVLGEYPTGTVEFFSDGVSLGVASISGDRAVFQTASLPAGAHTLTARYSGDSANTGSESAAVAFTVARAATQSVLSVDRTAVNLGQTITLTATVRGASPAGEVEFFADGESLGRAVLSRGVATLQTSSLGSGEHSLTAEYLGDPNHEGSPVEDAVTVTVATAPAPEPAPEPDKNDGAGTGPAVTPQAAPKASLAVSGSDTSAIWVTGGLLLAAGALLVMRRRRAHS